MNESGIIYAIELYVTDYSSWTIGVTNNPERQKAEQGNPEKWYHWETIGEPIARNIEKHFLDKGMKAATGGGDNPNYVYIFYKPTEAPMETVS